MKLEIYRWHWNTSKYGRITKQETLKATAQTSFKRTRFRIWIAWSIKYFTLPKSDWGRSGIDSTWKGFTDTVLQSTTGLQKFGRRRSFSRASRRMHLHTISANVLFNFNIWCLLWYEVWCMLCCIVIITQRAQFILGATRKT